MVFPCCEKLLRCRPCRDATLSAVIADVGSVVYENVTSQLAELGKKTDAINQLKKDLAEKNVMNVALEARTKPLRDQLRAAEEELQRKSNALVEADRQLAQNQAELGKVLRELGERAPVA